MTKHDHPELAQVLAELREVLKELVELRKVVEGLRSAPAVTLPPPRPATEEPCQPYVRPSPYYPSRTQDPPPRRPQVWCGPVNDPESLT